MTRVGLDGVAHHPRCLIVDGWGSRGAFDDIPTRESLCQRLEPVPRPQQVGDCPAGLGYINLS